MLNEISINSTPELIKLLIIICPLVFFAGFVDAVAGGGGIISLPAYLITGLPAHFAAGTNKMVNGIGTTMSAWKYIKGGKVAWKIALISAGGSLVGSVIGTNLALLFREDVLRIIIITAIPAVALFLLLKKDFGKDEKPERKLTGKAEIIASAIIGLVIGCYDGLIGPGTGTFLILAFTGILGLDLLLSSGCAKLSNLASNIASMIVFMVSGKIIYMIALPAAAFSVAGNYLGAKFALKNGSKFVRKMLFVVLALLFAKLLFDLFS